jgi:crotonobetainyl-CoA:carnitine CoA-transferase CaiB-like acyl-CoA transferase
VSGPLDGVLVADFSRVLAGPLAGATLADLGATVVKVERPTVGDDTRHWGPPWTQNSSSYFECANRGKQSVELDLSDAQDRKIAQELARRADVILENFKDGTLAHSGLSYHQVAATNPGIVYASITGFGSREGRDLPGYDFLVQAVGGLMSITGTPEQPTKVGVALVDVLTAKDTVIGVLSALRAREATGVGQRVEVNLLSSLLSSLANQASSYLATGTSPGRMGNQHPSIAPYETLAAKDGHVAVCCGNDGQFRKLAGVLGVTATADDPRFATNAARVTHRDALLGLLEQHLAIDTVDAWIEKLTAVGVPAGAVGSIADAIDLAQGLGLDPTVDVGPDAPAQVRNPITFSATPITDYVAPPRLGEHNDAVRRWLTEETPCATPPPCRPSPRSTPPASTTS